MTTAVPDNPPKASLVCAQPADCLAVVPVLVSWLLAVSTISVGLLAKERESAPEEPVSGLVLVQ